MQIVQNKAVGPGTLTKAKILRPWPSQTLHTLKMKRSVAESRSRSSKNSMCAKPSLSFSLSLAREEEMARQSVRKMRAIHNQKCCECPVAPKKEKSRWGKKGKTGKAKNSCGLSRTESLEYIVSKDVGLRNCMMCVGMSRETLTALIRACGPRLSRGTNNFFGVADFQGGVGYFSKERGFSVEPSLQRISSNLWLWKRNDSSVVLKT